MSHQHPNTLTILSKATFFSRGEPLNSALTSLWKVMYDQFMVLDYTHYIPNNIIPFVVFEV